MRGLQRSVVVTQYPDGKSKIDIVQRDGEDDKDGKVIFSTWATTPHDVQRLVQRMQGKYKVMRANVSYVEESTDS